MTTLSLDVVRSAYDALPLTKDQAFRRIFDGGKFRYKGADGAPDLVDEYSARLVCSALRSGTSDPVLIVLPDRFERRAPLLFSIALIMDGLAHIEAGKVGRCVLYVSSHVGIRQQLSSTHLGSITLDSVFAQQYGRGTGDDLHGVSGPGGIYLPSVLCIYAPADPAALLKRCRPEWVAVDCGDSHELPWLPSLVLEARKMGVPVVGWTASPFSGAVDRWLEAGGGVFRWPKSRKAAGPRITTLEQLSKGMVDVEVTPRILIGEHVAEISKAFATATEALLAARECQAGPLSEDAVMVGWKYLRALESVPVPLQVYEREANSYWGMRRLGDLRDDFARFVEAIESLSPELHAALQNASDALSRAHERIGSSDSPLWLGLANLCVDSGPPRRILFGSKAKREMFSFCLLARFNISEDDLRDVGVGLGYVSQAEEPDLVNFDLRTSEGASAESMTPLLVGMPSRFAERHLDTFLDSGRLEVLLWPHHEPLFERRLRHLSSKLEMSSRNLGRFLPHLRGEGPIEQRALKLVRPREATTGALREELRRKAEVVSLWKRTDASEAIAGLFGSMEHVEDEESYTPSVLWDQVPPESGAAADNPWVQKVLEIHLEGGLSVLLPPDETVNVILRDPRGAEVQPRYVRSLRAGDEILFIQGQRRQSLYELLVSRVHRDPGIAQHLALVRRWQDDFARAFSEGERQGKVSPESLLEDLRSRGSGLTSPQTIRSWSRRQVLAPNDREDLRRIAEVLNLGFVGQYYQQIDAAGKRLKGLHISLSARLNRWLTSSAAESVAIGGADEVIDAELGLTVEDFRHSLLRLRVLDVRQRCGPFYRPNLGRLEGVRS